MNGRMLAGFGTLAVALAAITLPGNLPATPAEAIPGVVLVEYRMADSLQVRLTWSAAPRAQWYTVHAGGDDGAWEARVDVPAPALEAQFWALMGDEPSTAFACVTAWNRHPTRGDQEGGTRCVAWTVPGDLQPPGQPGDVQVLPDTVEMALVSWPRNMDVALEALGPNAVPVSYGYLVDGIPFTCVVMPDGVEGLLEAVVLDGWKQISAPDPRFYPLPDCHPRGSQVGGPADLMRVVWAPNQPRLEVWPGATPVILYGEPEVWEALRNSAPTSGSSEA